MRLLKTPMKRSLLLSALFCLSACGDNLPEPQPDGGVPDSFLFQRDGGPPPTTCPIGFCPDARY